MAGGILSTEITQDIKYVDVTIANGEALSDAADLKAHRLHHMILPAGMEAVDITLQVSPDSVAAYVDVYDSSGTFKAVPAAVAGASRCVIVNMAYAFGFQFLKVKTASNVGAARTIRLGLVPR